MIRRLTESELAKVGLTSEMVCGKKKRYYSARHAQLVASQARQRSDHLNIRAYRCPVHPGHWHIGHESNRLRNLMEDLRDGKEK